MFAIYKDKYKIKSDLRLKIIEEIQSEEKLNICQPLNSDVYLDLTLREDTINTHKINKF